VKINNVDVYQRLKLWKNPAAMMRQGRALDRVEEK
jgi:hypothetical protein